VTAPWIPLSLLCAFSLATSDALVKRALERHNEYLILWLRLLLASPFLLSLLAFIPLPPLAPPFYRATLLSLLLEVMASILYIKALKLSPLSQTLPLLALTPLFLLVIPWLLLGERISSAGRSGVLLIVGGTYLLNIGGARKNLLEPLRAIVRDRGARCMLGVALIYSITSTLGKQAIEASSPLFFAATYVPLLTLFLTPLALRNLPGGIRGVISGGAARETILPALFYALMALSHMTAISMTSVAYMISLKRLSLLMGVIYGRVMFKEAGIAGRLAGTLLMLWGVALISLYP
jgi:drug/metabolite transporter (DMT)-like permease